MTKLWKKGDSKLHKAVEAYIAGTDHIFDVELLPFDIEVSAAHAKSLAKIDILTKVELKEILGALDTLSKEAMAGKVAITPEDEDSHSVIENYLIQKIGETGKKIHTGRSRN